MLKRALPSARGDKDAGAGAITGVKRSREQISGTEAAPAAAEPATLRSRTLVLGSRGITSRFRHFMMDMRTMIPHHKKDAKVRAPRVGFRCIPAYKTLAVQLDAKDTLTVVNEIAEAKGCGTTLYFDVRKKRDLYLWAAATPSGPSVKFHVVNVHTMDELRMTGNCLKSSRAVLAFDRAFDDEEGAPHLRLMRELLTRAFAAPRKHPKVQPFHDHVINFGYADGKVWFRHYQVVDKAVDAKTAAKMLAAGEQPTVLVEIGPRCVLDPIRIFAGSFGGATLWLNPAYVSPNAVRRELSLAKAGRYTARIAAVTERKDREEERVGPEDPVADVFKAERALELAPAAAAAPPPAATAKVPAAAAVAAEKPKRKREAPSAPAEAPTPAAAPVAQLAPVLATKEHSGKPSKSSETTSVPAKPAAVAAQRGSRKAKAKAVTAAGVTVSVAAVAPATVAPAAAAPVASAARQKPSTALPASAKKRKTSHPSS